jgi:hypothetical protein
MSERHESLKSFVDFIRDTLVSPRQNQDLMSHQDGLGKNGSESTRVNQPDDGDNRMQTERENVALAFPHMRYSTTSLISRTKFSALNRNSARPKDKRFNGKMFALLQ